MLPRKRKLYSNVTKLNTRGFFADCDVRIRNYIKNGELIHILPDWSSNIRDKYLIYNHREYQPEKLKIFIDFVSKYSLPN